MNKLERFGVNLYTFNYKVTEEYRATWGPSGVSRVTGAIFETDNIGAGILAQATKVLEALIEETIELGDRLSHKNNYNFHQPIDGIKYHLEKKWAGARIKAFLKNRGIIEESLRAPWEVIKEIWKK